MVYIPYPISYCELVLLAVYEFHASLQPGGICETGFSALFAILVSRFIVTRNIIKLFISLSTQPRSKNGLVLHLYQKAKVAIQKSSRYFENIARES